MEVDSSKTKNRLKVLIADDDTPTRILLRAAVSQWGYEVIEAKDGEEAWEILQTSNQPDLLILDWLMPKLDGIGLCSRIRERADYYPYIILLTQVTGSTNIVKGLEAGANEFLSKPFNMAELRSRLSTGKRMIEYDKKLENVIQLIEQTKSKLSALAKQLRTLSESKSEVESIQLKKLYTEFEQLTEELHIDNTPNED